MCGADFLDSRGFVDGREKRKEKEEKIRQKKDWTGGKQKRNVTTAFLESSATALPWGGLLGFCTCLSLSPLSNWASGEAHS